MTQILETSADQIRAATGRLVRTVDALTDDDWASPSLLPGWNRSHVVAHLILNAEGLGGAVRGLVEGRRTSMYASDPARDDDIAHLATATPGTLRERLSGAVTLFDDALAAFAAADPALGEGFIDRTPEGTRRFPASDVANMRLREVEIHHADLGCAYGPTGWPAEFALALIDHAVDGRRSGADLALIATDTEASWRLGDGSSPGATVRGPVRGLAWWLTGRAPYPGAEVTSDDGVLPRIEGL